MRKRFSVVFVLSLLITACSGDISVPYVYLDLDSSYETEDVAIAYSYQCEENTQRCVYSLYNLTFPSDPVETDDGVLANSGTLKFTGLEDGSYYLTFEVYSYRNGTYTLLDFMTANGYFTVSLP